MASAMLASLVSRMISRPLYDTLAEHMIASLVSRPETAATRVDEAATSDPADEDRSETPK